MKLIKVLGIGSPFGDDQVGWSVVDVLKKLTYKEAHIHSQVNIENSDRPGVRLLDLIKGFNTVYIIDAVKSGSKVGTIYRFKKESILDSENQFSTHGFGVLQTLQLGNALNMLPENISFYGVEIDNIILDSTLSQPINNVIEDLALRLKNEIMHILT